MNINTGEEMSMTLHMQARSVRSWELEAQLFADTQLVMWVLLSKCWTSCLCSKQALLTA